MPVVEHTPGQWEPLHHTAGAGPAGPSQVLVELHSLFQRGSVAAAAVGVVPGRTGLEAARLSADELEQWFEQRSEGW